MLQRLQSDAGSRTRREKEFAVRTALGASRWSMLRQLLVESLILALLGGTLGIALAWTGLQTLVSLVPPDVIAAETVIQLNGPVLLFALALSFTTALLFGLVPALQAARRDVIDHSAPPPAEQAAASAMSAFAMPWWSWK